MKKIDYTIVIIGLVSIIMSLFLHYTDAYSLIETKLYDTRFKIRGPLLDWNSDVVLLEIDDEAYRLIPEPYPYPRGNVWSRVIKNLTDAGAKVIAFDIQFDSDDHTTQAIQNSIKGECLNCEFENQDEQFYNAIKYAFDNKTKVVLAAKIGYESSRIPPDYIVMPNQNIMQAQPYIGLVDHEVDIIDNVSRRYTVFSSIPSNPNNKILSFGVQSVLSFLDLDSKIIITEDLENDLININSLEIKAYRKEASFLVNFYGARSSLYNTFPRYPLSNVIDNYDYQLKDSLEDNDWIDMYINKQHPLYSYYGFNKSPFKDKIVIIGSTLLEDHDLKETPFFSYQNEENLTPGMEFHANAMQQLIHGNYINAPTQTLKLTNESFYFHLLITLFFTVLILLVSNYFSILYSTLLTFFIGFLWFSFSMGTFINDNFWIFNYILSAINNQYYTSSSTNLNQSFLLPVFPPIATILLTYGINLSYNLFNEQKNKNFLKETFGRYISPELIDEMYDNKKMPELGGESGIRTAFFSDIESFSTISEQLTASELVDLLNDFLSNQTEILINNHGTLDKYEGDAILAFFGAPVYYEDHARQAIDTGVEMHNKLKLLKKKWMNQKYKWPDDVLKMNMRIGINTGEMVTGNMGSKLHMNYTMMGSVVNLAARLESAAKYYGIYFHTTYNTIKDAGIDRYEWRYIDRVIFKGLSKWNQTIEVFGYKGEVDKNINKLINNFHRGLECYYEKKWDEALLFFNKSNKYETILNKNTINPSKVFISRIKENQNQELPPDWIGVVSLDEK